MSLNPNKDNEHHVQHSLLGHASKDAWDRKVQLAWCSVFILNSAPAFIS